MTDRTLLDFDGVWKSYSRPGGRQLHALREVTVAAGAVDSIAIVGRSGSGKSTFLHLAAAIDEPTRGRIRFAGRDIGAMSERERTLHRRENIGLVFQFFHLLPHLNVRDNVALPAIIAGEPRARYVERAELLLARVGLADRVTDDVLRLSGGEMQRVAICRALLRRPRLLLADEPTGNLDDDTGRSVMDLLLALVREEQSALIYVTHSRETAARADRTWRMHSGTLDPS
ncbi:MAG TPA: ABC transporter ATP-binding protein [Candidatus Polarisedimenticolaceae bacterium]|nr:ABC transporter ATP-binding protein [Candidatus Polarisedimenticolaceae bacterium]